MTELIEGFKFGLGFSIAYSAINWGIWWGVKIVTDHRKKKAEQAHVTAMNMAQKELAPEQAGDRPIN